MEYAMEAFMKAAMESGGLTYVMDSTNAAAAEQSLDALERFAERFEVQVQKKIIAHRRLRNACVPISRLPPEILTLIIQLHTTTLDSYYSEELLNSLQELSSVCAGWNALVSESAELWAVVSLRYSLSTVQKALRKSKSCPLAVMVMRGSDLNMPVSEEDECKLEMMLRPVNRWRSVHILDMPVQTVNRILALEAPQIQHLDIGHTDSEGQSMSGLRDIPMTVKGGKISMLRGLLSLYLQSLKTVGISVAQLLECLCASPQLTELSLRDVTFKNEASRPPCSTSPAQLPSLRSLCLTDTSPCATHDILKNIRIPNCSELLVFSKNDGEVAVFDEETGHLESAIRLTLLSAPHVRISWSSIMKTIRATEVGDDDGRAPLLLNLSAMGWRDLTAWLINILETVSPLPFIHLVAAAPFSQCRALLESRCPIATFHFRGPYDQNLSVSGFSELVKFLSSVGAGQSQWPLPHLRRLILADTGVWAGGEAVLSMVARRYGRVQTSNCRGGEGALSSVAPLPSSLDSLEIKGANVFTRDDIKELEAVVGRGQVEWDENDNDDESDEEEWPYADDVHQDVIW